MPVQTLVAVVAMAAAVGCGGGHDPAPVAPAPAPEPDAATTERAAPQVEPDEAVAVRWARSFSGSSYSAAWGTAIGPDGAVVVAGAFEGTIDLDPGRGVEEQASGGDLDAFVAVLDADGDLRWGRTLGGDGEDSAREAVIRADGSIVVAGCFEGTVDFDAGPGTELHTANGETDAYATVLGPNGAARWTRTFGGAGVECALRVDARRDGSVVLVGGFDGTTDLDPGAALDAHASAGEFDVFVVALGPDGDLRWGRAFGGTGDDVAAALGVGERGEVSVGGWFEGTVDLDPGQGTSRTESAGSSDAFVMRLDAGGALAWVRTFGGPEPDKVVALAVGPDGSITASGSFEATADLDPGPGQRLFVAKGASDAFVVQVDAAGATRWVQSFGEESIDDGVGVTALADRSVIVATQGHPFLVRLDPRALPVWSWTPRRNEATCEAWSLESAPDGAVAVVGAFRDAIDFDPGPGADLHRPSSDTDPAAFVVRLQVRPGAD
jgi:hypothetical protein